MVTTGKVLLKTGETIELSFEEMIDFVIRNREVIQVQHSEKPFGPRRQPQSPTQ